MHAPSTFDQEGNRERKVNPNLYFWFYIAQPNVSEYKHCLKVRSLINPIWLWTPFRTVMLEQFPCQYCFHKKLSNFRIRRDCLAVISNKEETNAPKPLLCQYDLARNSNKITQYLICEVNKVIKVTRFTSLSCKSEARWARAEQVWHQTDHSHNPRITDQTILQWVTSPSTSDQGRYDNLSLFEYILTGELYLHITPLWPWTCTTESMLTGCGDTSLTAIVCYFLDLNQQTSKFQDYNIEFDFIFGMLQYDLLYLLKWSISCKLFVNSTIDRKNTLLLPSGQFYWD